MYYLSGFGTASYSVVFLKKRVTSLSGSCTGSESVSPRQLWKLRSLASTFLCIVFACFATHQIISTDDLGGARVDHPMPASCSLPVKLSQGESKRQALDGWKSLFGPRKLKAKQANSSSQSRKDSCQVVSTIMIIRFPFTLLTVLKAFGVWFCYDCLK